MTYAELSESLQSTGGQAYLLIGGAALLLAFFLFLLLRRQPKKIVAYTTDDGAVLVARSAIRELVQSACEQLEGVNKPRTRIRIKGGRAHFDIEVKLVGSCRLKQVESTLQRHMRQALAENLGIEQLGSINVIATGFKSGRVEQSQVSPPAKNPVDTTDGAPDATTDGKEGLSTDGQAGNEAAGETRK